MCIRSQPAIRAYNKKHNFNLRLTPGRWAVYPHPIPSHTLGQAKVPVSRLQPPSIKIPLACLPSQALASSVHFHGGRVPRSGPRGWHGPGLGIVPLKLVDHMEQQRVLLPLALRARPQEEAREGNEQDRAWIVDGVLNPDGALTP